MGFAPPKDFPPPSDDPVVDFPPSPVATICGFSLSIIPRFNILFPPAIPLPPIGFPPPIPFPFFAFELSCDPTKPIDVMAGLNRPFGGGRTFNAPPDPDLNEETP